MIFCGPFPRNVQGTDVCGLLSKTLAYITLLNQLLSMSNTQYFELFDFGKNERFSSPQSTKPTIERNRGGGGYTRMGLIAQGPPFPFSHHLIVRPKSAFDKSSLRPTLSYIEQVDSSLPNVAGLRAGAV